MNGNTSTGKCWIRTLNWYAQTLVPCNIIACKVSSAKELHKSININFTPLKSLSTDTCVIATAKTIHAQLWKHLAVLFSLVMKCTIYFCTILHVKRVGTPRALVLRFKVSCSQQPHTGGMVRDFSPQHSFSKAHDILSW